jgi:large subunit ribosomal protein L5
MATEKTPAAGAKGKSGGSKKGNDYGVVVERGAHQKGVAPRYAKKYKEAALPELKNRHPQTNVMQFPRIMKIIVNSCQGDATQNIKALEAAAAELEAITGQKAVFTRAKKSIAAFKLREGMPIGAMVTLRRERMWEFYDRLVSVVLPRIRDFRGVSPNSFDGRGNYSIGLREQTIFPEIEADKVDKTRGLSVTIVTSAATDDAARELLALMDMPFRK